MQRYFYAVVINFYFDPQKLFSQLVDFVQFLTVLDKCADLLAQVLFLVALLVLQVEHVVQVRLQLHDLHSLHVVEVSVPDEFEKVNLLLKTDEIRLFNQIGLQK